MSQQRPHVKQHDLEATLFAAASRRLASAGFGSIEFDIGGKKSRRKFIRAVDRNENEIVIWVKAAYTWPGKADLLLFTWKKYQGGGLGSGHKAVEYSCRSAQSRGASHLLALIGNSEGGALHFAQLYTLDQVADLAYKQSLALGGLIYKAHPACVIVQSYTPEYDEAATLALAQGIDVLTLEGKSERPQPREIRHVRTGRAYTRDPRVRDRVLQIAGGACECCGEIGFTTEDGTPYLETHHIIEVSSRGPDSVDNVVAVCANCHRKAHFSVERIAIERRMMEAIRRRGRADA